MNHYPTWRYLMVLIIVGLGALYAAPNLYGTDPALQVSARRSAPVDESFKSQVESALAEAVFHKRITDSIRTPVAVSGPEKPFRIHVIDEQSLFHIADFVQCRCREQRS